MNRDTGKSVGRCRQTGRGHSVWPRQRREKPKNRNSAGDQILRLVNDHMVEWIRGPSKVKTSAQVV
jgi:hypothetical protein